MFYLGYCNMCNHLDADQDRNSLFDNFLDHQEEKHGTVDSEAIRIFGVNLPYRIWLVARQSADFWEAWRHRKQPSYVLGRLEYLRRSQPVP